MDGTNACRRASCGDSNDADGLSRSPNTKQESKKLGAIAGKLQVRVQAPGLGPGPGPGSGPGPSPSLGPSPGPAMR
jgi:hypothetical protein